MSLPRLRPRPPPPLSGPPPPPAASGAAAMAMRQTPLTCSGHTRPVVDLAFSGVTPYGYFLISACKGERGRAAAAPVSPAPLFRPARRGRPRPRGWVCGEGRGGPHRASPPHRRS